MRTDQLRYLCQVMVIVLRNKIQMIHEPHELLETRMLSGGMQRATRIVRSRTLPK